ncbi:hypothetical protein C7H19_15365 [Aphanothece hegewaldii CCALA 016]|uniref:Uncharacterized protein n=1 Tax=Aphanothece hegewaldii CCALA 016 TaxID=2107694 RepID=A0A2T1LVP4_9CHRO|nr:hypothetical protein C7H19_15365 [Aphanothece hegewaldii CCALA 016]
MIGNFFSRDKQQSIHEQNINLSTDQGDFIAFIFIFLMLACSLTFSRWLNFKSFQDNFFKQHTLKKDIDKYGQPSTPKTL